MSLPFLENSSYSRPSGKWVVVSKCIKLCKGSKPIWNIYDLTQYQRNKNFVKIKGN